MLQKLRHTDHQNLWKAEMMYRDPTILFKREKDTLLEVIIETIDTFNGDFGSHDHTLQNIPQEWF